MVKKHVKDQNWFAVALDFIYLAIETFPDALQLDLLWYQESLKLAGAVIVQDSGLIFWRLLTFFSLETQFLSTGKFTPIADVHLRKI